MTEMHMEADNAKLYGILAIAVSAAGMTRVFEKGSARKIRDKLALCIDGFLNARSEEEYRYNHDEFCGWFVRQIKTAAKKPASWGQAAKVIDIVLKVCVYYCNLPSARDSLRIAPWINAAIDTQRLKALKEKYPELEIPNVNTVQDIDREVYQKLQDKMREEIKHPPFNGKIWPVQYDDIKWREENP